MDEYPVGNTVFGMCKASLDQTNCAYARRFEHAVIVSRPVQDETQQYARIDLKKRTHVSKYLHFVITFFPADS